MNIIIEIFKNMRVRKSGLIFSTLVLLAFFAGFQPLLLSKSETKTKLDFSNFPMQFGNWKGEESVGLDIRSLDILRLSTYIRRRYTDNLGRSVFLYIGYWANQTGEHQAAKHSPAICLPSNGWQTFHLEDKSLEVESGVSPATITVRRLQGELRSSKELFYYWFFAGNEYYSQEWFALIKLSLANVLYGKNDGGIVEVSTEIKKGVSSEKSLEDSDQVVKDFLIEVAPYLHKKIKGES